MMEAARTSETLVNFYQTTRCYNPEDSHLQIKTVVWTDFLCCLIKIITQQDVLKIAFYGFIATLGTLNHKDLLKNPVPT
jgi:hypothetical protein